jgi:hypothetical protein
MTERSDSSGKQLPGPSGEKQAKGKTTPAWSVLIGGKANLAVDLFQVADGRWVRRTAAGLLVIAGGVVLHVAGAVFYWVNLQSAKGRRTWWRR